MARDAFSHAALFHATHAIAFRNRSTFHVHQRPVKRGREASLSICCPSTTAPESALTTACGGAGWHKEFKSYRQPNDGGEVPGNERHRASGMEEMDGALEELILHGGGSLPREDRPDAAASNQQRSSLRSIDQSPIHADSPPRVANRIGQQSAIVGAGRTSRLTPRSAKPPPIIDQAPTAGRLVILFVARDDLRRSRYPAAN